MKRRAKVLKQGLIRTGECHTSKFTAVVDGRKQKIRGLLIRNEVFYAQMRVRSANGESKPVRIRLDAKTLIEARAEAERRRTEKRDGSLHLPGRRPLFSALVENYKVSAVFLGKKEGTRQNETQALERWVAHVGGKRIDWIDTGAITSFRDKRSREGVTNRTINLDVTAFNNAMRHAVDMGWITIAPRLKKLREAPPVRRPLLKKSEINLLLRNARVSKNHDLFGLYVRFLIATGAREQEALKVRKADIDKRRKVVRIGASGDTKNRKGRDIQFNSSLEKVVEDLLRKSPPDTQWLFPSPQRGTKDIPASTFRETLRLVREAAGLEWVGFHDFRHYFASQAVMAGIDFMTIAAWLGHQDGGALVAKVYGHINDQHQRRAAKKLSL
jgi:integrase